ncbi:hypothetical protein IW261DRAFT_1425802 [Armillaria novae-zelandiae]|uniref:Uncharacterized protein n=1 Tax=Armillaria novae-zelandiae TaxID=153914 RepID=A0AA39TZ43_9AGAR|nr:hypothetical protein IW261DRAFT_1425802 [Armillaria novae-zelandiae]
MVCLSSGAHAALESSFKKEPILWDADQCASYSGRDLVKKVDRIHSAMCQFVLEAERPWPEDIQAFLATISKNLFDIPAKLHLDVWQQWSLALVTAKHIITQYGERSTLPVREPSPEPSASGEDGSPSPMPPPKHQKTSASSLKGKGKETKPVVKMDVQQFGLPDVPKVTSKAVAPKTETKPTARGSRVKTTGSPTPGVSAPPAKKTKPVVVHKGRAWGRNAPEEPIDDTLNRMSPPPTTLAEEITNTVDSRETTPVTMETLLQHTTMDLAIIGVLKVPPSGSCSECSSCVTKRISCKHENRTTSCPGCEKTGFCSCMFDADVLWDVKECMFQVNYSCNSFLEFHERCFRDADDNVAACIVQLQRAYETQAATFANIVQALDQIKCDHDTDTVLKVARKYPVSHRLFIEMGYQVGKEYQEIDDAVQAKAASVPDFARAASVPPIAMIVEPAPSPIKEEPGLVVPSLLLGSTIEVVPDSDDAVVILDSPAKVDNLLCRASDASSVYRVRNIKSQNDRYLLLREAQRQFPHIVDLDTLARLLQPEIQDLFDLVHPFLPSRQIAHEQFYPHDEDPVSLRFLATVTSLVNNLSPAFQSGHWFAWKMTDPCFEPSDLFPGEVSASSLGILSARCPQLCLTPTGAFKQGLNWFHFHMLSLAEDMTQKLPAPEGTAHPFDINNMSSPFYAFSFAKKRMPDFDHKLGNLSANIAADCHCLLHWVHNRYPEILDFSVIAYWSQLELASLIGLVHPFLELGGLFGPDDQFPGDEGLPYPRYGSKLFFHVEPVLLGEFVAVGLNAIQLGSETLPSRINAAFELLYLAGAYPVCYLPVLVPEESIFHLNSYV